MHEHSVRWTCICAATFPNSPAYYYHMKKCIIRKKLRQIWNKVDYFMSQIDPDVQMVKKQTKKHWFEWDNTKRVNNQGKTFCQARDIIERCSVQQAYTCHTGGSLSWKKVASTIGLRMWLIWWNLFDKRRFSNLCSNHWRGASHFYLRLWGNVF